MRTCFSFTKISINLLSLFISLIITLSVNLCAFNKDNFSITANVKVDNKISTNEIHEENNSNWKLKIPRIELNAKISEGTSKEVLDEYIGHFEETEKEFGNVGLAAHNRGYNVNYFERLKELKIGDELIYTYKNDTKHYEVSLVTIIEDTDWKSLENTEDNRLTLITCLENEPNKRRCIQAKEKIN